MCKLPEGTRLVMPGDNVAIGGRADRPRRHGRRSCAFAIREGAAPSAPAWWRRSSMRHEAVEARPPRRGRVFRPPAERPRRVSEGKTGAPMNGQNYSHPPQGVDHGCLTASTREIVSTAKRTGAGSCPIPLPTRPRAFTVCVRRNIRQRSPREQFEMRHATRRPGQSCTPRPGRWTRVMKLDLAAGVDVEIQALQGRPASTSGIHTPEEETQHALRRHRHRSFGIPRLTERRRAMSPVPSSSSTSVRSSAHATKEKNGYVALQVGRGLRQGEERSKASRGGSPSRRRGKRSARSPSYRVSEDAVSPGGRGDHGGPTLVGQVLRRDRHVEGQGLRRRP